MPTPLNKADLNDPVTTHMRQDFVQLPFDQTVGEALATLRERQPVGRIIYFYVTDRESRLRGVVPTRRLLLSSPETPVSGIMVPGVIAIPSSATVLDACEFFVLHKLLAFPVVDEERRLVGLVDVDLYTEEMSDLERREGSDTLFQLIGVHLTSSRETGVLQSCRQRFPWLLCNVGAGCMAAFLSGMFEAELQKVVALALFIPVVLALAESVSIQSVSLTLEKLHGSRPTVGGLLPKLGREGSTGAFLGLACGLLVALVALLWIGKPMIAVCVLGGIAGGVTVAALLGVSIPTVLRLLRREPQVASGPIVLAATDMITLLLYFVLARWLLE